ncbi:MAG: hypothetical protein DMF86_16130 [Acidobacteria bacterium]|nr:MAG: hypothetical protein DMF86_16130 [Acidobacteriota bacterium]
MNMTLMSTFAWTAVAAVGCAAGYGLSPAGSLRAQRGDPNAANAQHQAPEFTSVIPAPQLRQPVPMWPNQPKDTTYWSIDDIRKAHETLSAAYAAGRAVDPNTALHDFPYWTRTHALFVSHTPYRQTGVTANQHAGYAQFIVVMGGTGRVVAGGQIEKREMLSEGGRPIPGEYRGASIAGGETFTLKEGDWISIPPDTPARFQADPGGLTCMVMKVNAMLYPWDLIR